MQTILSTTGMRPAEAFEYWLDVACAKLIEHKSEPLDYNNFFAELKAGSLADLSIFTWRMAATVGRNKSDDVLLLMLPLQSCLQFEFADRSIKVDGGNLCLIDMRETHLGRATQSINMIGLPIPRNLLERRIRITKQVTNRPIAVQGDAELLADYLRATIRIGPSTMSPMTRIITRSRARSHRASARQACRRGAQAGVAGAGGDAEGARGN